MPNVPDTTELDTSSEILLAHQYVIRRPVFMENVVREAIAYIAEAEHQEGEVYWLDFANDDEVLEDFARHILAKLGAGGGP